MGEARDDDDEQGGGKMDLYFLLHFSCSKIILFQDPEMTP